MSTTGTPAGPTRDIIVIGASAGGLDALKTLIAGLPGDLPAAVFVVWHMPPEHSTLLPEVLDRQGALAVCAASDGQPIQTGRIYVAPPDHHLVLEPPANGQGVMHVTRGPRENRFRPSIDVLFRSAARAYGPRVIGVVLTGLLDDGASGLYAIKQHGGLAVVQDPVDALYPDMPINAMKAVRVDGVAPVAEMDKLLVALVSPAATTGTSSLSQEGGRTVEQHSGEQRNAEERLEMEVGIAREANALESGVLNWGKPSIYTCPECHGTLMQLREGPLLRFRCHTGHAYTLAALAAGVTESVENTLWSALRAIEESELVMQHLARHMRENRQDAAAAEFEGRVEAARERARLVRQAVLGQP